MLEVTLELVVAVSFLCVTLIILYRRRSLPESLSAGANFILFGFALMTFGAIVGATHHYPSLNHYVVFGETHGRAVFEHIAYLLGGISLALAFYKTAPHLLRGELEASRRRAAERAARQLRIAVEGIDESVSLYDAQDRFVWCNTTFRELNQAVPETLQEGVTFEDHLRALLENGLVPDAIGREESWLQWRMDRHRNPQRPFELERQEGRILLISERRLESGETITLGTDISERKWAEDRLRQSEARATMLMERAADAIFVHHINGRVVDANAKACENLGYTRDELRKMKIWDFEMAVSPEELGETWTGMRTDTIINVRGTHLRKDGTMFPVEVRLSAIIIDGERMVLAMARDISERVQAERAVRDQLYLLETMIENIPSPVFYKDVSGRYLGGNAEFEKFIGLDAEAFIGKTVWEIAPPETAKIYDDADRALLNKGGTQVYEGPVKYADGSMREVIFNKATFNNAEDEIAGLIGIILDISERKAAERNNATLATVLEQAGDAIEITDPEGIITYVNPSFERATGYRKEDVVGRSVSEIYGPVGKNEAVAVDIMAALARGETWSGIYHSRTKSGERRIVDARISPVQNANGEIAYHVAIKRDITRQKEQEAALFRQANYDEITGLPNRGLFMDRLEHAMQHADRNDKSVGVLFIDLDRFKDVNDTLGHSQGDLLLEKFGERLASAIRGEDTVARIGGDEFTVLLEGIKSVDDVSSVCETLVKALEDPFNLAGHNIFITPSIGISIYPADGGDADTLLRHADAAMYQVKAEGRNGYRFFTESLNERIRERIQIEARLRHALENETLRLFYQPIARAEDGKIETIEALLRWHDEELGDVAPDRFIPLAEENGLISPVGDWVLHRALRDLSEVLSIPNCHDIRIALNVSSRQFRQPNYAASVLRAAGAYRISPDQVELEITERILIDRGEQTLAIMDELSNAGIRLVIDDFGTGYSSLSYLKKFPISSIKIDRAFIEDIHHSSENAAIVDAIIAMAASLGLEVVSEGVETFEQLEKLRLKQCQFIQGYYLARPMPFEDLKVLLMEKGGVAAADLSPAAAFHI